MSLPRQWTIVRSVQLENSPSSEMMKAAVLYAFGEPSKMSLAFGSGEMKAVDPKRILIVNAHPDGGKGHLCDALADAYQHGVRGAGHEVARIDLASIGVPLLGSKREFEDGEIPYQLGNAADELRSADHLVFVFPLWLGTMPALLKAWI